MFRKLKLAFKILSMKHFFIFSIDDVNLYLMYKREPFDIEYESSGLHQPQIDTIIEELYYSKDSIDRVVDWAIFESEIDDIINKH